MAHKYRDSTAYLFGRTPGGLLWMNMSDRQKKEVAENFYDGRRMRGAELTTYRYHFGSEGQCEYAD